MISYFTVILCVLGITAAAKLPDKFPRCKRLEPNFDDCLKSAMQTSLPYLTKGVPNLGLIPFDPLRITKLDIKQGNGPVAVDLKFENLDIKNIKSAIFNKVTSNLDNYKLLIDVTLQEPLVIDGDYEIGGKVLILPISGKGKAHLKLENVHCLIDLQGKELKKDGDIYMDLVDLKLTFDTSKLQVHFGNLFNNDKALGDNMNAFLNENWKEILQELKPAIEDALAAAFLEISRRLFNKVTYENIFPH